MILQHCNPTNAPQVWSLAKPILELALKHSFMEANINDVYEQILSGNQLLWLGLENNKVLCAGTTTVVVYPRKTVLRIILFASKTRYAEYLLDAFEKMQNYAVQNNYDAIETWARKGVSKIIKWDHEYSVLVKQLKEN